VLVVIEMVDVEKSKLTFATADRDQRVELYFDQWDSDNDGLISKASRDRFLYFDRNWKTSTFPYEYSRHAHRDVIRTLSRNRHASNLLFTMTKDEL
jgi:hypothetical protein